MVYNLYFQQQNCLTIHFYLLYFISYLDFKWSILHNSLTENIFLVGIEKNVNQKNIQLNFSSEVSCTIKTQLKFIGLNFFDKNRFRFLARLSWFSYLWVSKCQISAFCY